MPALIACLRALDPPAHEWLLVDGGSSDATVALAQGAGIRTIISPARGRAVQINHGVEAATGDIVCVLHADSRLPPDGVKVIADTLANPKTALASFLPRIAGAGGTRWGTTLHNWAKTWYAPLIARPASVRARGAIAVRRSCDVFQARRFPERRRLRSKRRDHGRGRSLY